MYRLFGTDGIRARAGEFPLDQATVRVIGSSLTKLFADRLNREPTFVTGRDTRESGVWIEQALHAGAVSTGARVESASVVTTPGIAFLTGRFGFDAGIVISASHNPFEDNGIKVFLPEGRKLSGSDERRIEADIFDEISVDASRNIAGDSTRSREFQAAYIDHLISEVPGLSLGDFRMVVDCANGAASEIAPGVFERLNADLTVINNQPDGRNINLDCGSLHLDGLRQAVLNSDSQFGVAFDGDADRALFVDESGNMVDGDATLWVLARKMKADGQLVPSHVIATVMSNIGLELALKTEEIQLIRTAVGDKYVLDELLKTGGTIGGEQSGHIIFPHESLVGDGILTTLFLLDALRSGGQTLSQAVHGFTRFPQILINIPVREKRPFDSIPQVANAARQIESQLNGSGRLLLRYSGTENLARVMIEGSDQAEIEKIAKHLADIIRSEIG